MIDLRKPVVKEDGFYDTAGDYWELFKLESPICNLCGEYLLEPRKPFRRRGGPEVFCPWKCPTQGCSVLWWGNAGALPADATTRAARKELFDLTKSHDVNLGGRKIGQLSAKEARSLISLIVGAVEPEPPAQTLARPAIRQQGSWIETPRQIELD